MPQRSCVACRQAQAKRGLIRLVRTATGSVTVDESGRAPGRGAYLCHDPVCWERALEGDSLARALRARIASADRQALRAHASKMETAVAAAEVSDDDTGA